MKKLIEENYKSIVDRGLIKRNTSMEAFIMKIEEEVQEFIEATQVGTLEEIKEELADIILTCLNTAKHFGFDIESELNKKIEINKNR